MWFVVPLIFLNVIKCCPTNAFHLVDYSDWIDSETVATVAPAYPNTTVTPWAPPMPIAHFPLPPKCPNAHQPHCQYTSPCWPPSWCQAACLWPFSCWSQPPPSFMQLWANTLDTVMVGFLNPSVIWKSKCWLFCRIKAKLIPKLRASNAHVEVKTSDGCPGRWGEGSKPAAWLPGRLQNNGLL